MFDAIVLAGGSSRRLDGADKAAVDIGGRTLLDHSLDATRGAEQVIVVGPRRPTTTTVHWVEERPPGGGPVAATAAGLDHVAAHWCLVLAADLPRVAPAVPLLLTNAADVDVAVLTRDGRRNYLAAVWRSDALRESINSLETVDGAAVKQLFVGNRVVEVTDDADWSTDLDTWADIERARAKELR